MDAPSSGSPSSLSPILVTPGAVLPHSDTQFNPLANQTSHFEATIFNGGSHRLVHAASSTNAFNGSAAGTSRRRRRACSACCRVADAATPLQPAARQPASPIEPLRSSPLLHLGANAQACFAESYENTREGTTIDYGGQVRHEKDERDQTQRPEVVDVQSMALIPACTACSRACPCTSRSAARMKLTEFPNEVLLHILSYLDVNDLLATSRTSHHFRCLALSPTIHRLRLQHARAILPPLLTSPLRPSLADLINRHIFLTHTTVVSRKLARSLTAIRLSRRLAVRPPPEALVARSVLPPECVPGHARVAPSLVAKTRAVERERVKDGLRRWVGSVWEQQWREKAEARRRWEERSGVGRVWRLRRFWERVSRGEIEAH